MSAAFNPPGKLMYGVCLQRFDQLDTRNIVFREDDGERRHCVFWNCHFCSLTSRAVFLYSSITEGGDSFARCPLNKGTKSVLRLVLL